VAQYWIGSLYNTNHEGLGLVKGDSKTAFKWYQMSSTGNYTPALWFVGLAYENGDGCEKNELMAERYYRRGAALGHSECQNNLGALLMDRGNTVKSKSESLFAEAHLWFHLSAKQDNINAMQCIGEMYRCGKHVPMDLSKAVEWFNRCLQHKDITEDMARVIRRHISDQEKKEEKGPIPFNILITFSDSKKELHIRSTTKRDHKAYKRYIIYSPVNRDIISHHVEPGYERIIPDIVSYAHSGIDEFDLSMLADSSSVYVLLLEFDIQEFQLQNMLRRVSKPQS
jgi:hypothetical protein